MLGLVVFPLARLAIWPRERRVIFARATIHRLFQAFVAMMRACGVISWEVHGAERLRGHGRLILANHPTLIDVVLLMALVERSDVQAVEALAVVAEAAVAWELARAAREKFGGDALGDLVAAHAAYLERIRWRTP